MTDSTCYGQAARPHNLSAGMTGCNDADMSATRLEVDAGIATVTMTDTGRRNALSAELVGSLAAQLDDAVRDDAVRVIVLTNEGTTFCAGADLQAKPGSQTGGVVELFGAILDSPKPVVGRIAGHCMGGGVGLAAACDISVVADDARVGFTEVRIGVAPAMISVICLPKMGRADALELFLSGERIAAARAVEVGLFNRAVPRAELDAAVALVVATLVRGGPNALAASKRLVREVPGMDRDEAFAMTEELSAALFASDEAREGITAFREKRAPRWDVSSAAGEG